MALSLLTACQATGEGPTTSSAAKIDPPLAAAVQALSHGGYSGADVDARGRLLVYVFVTDTGVSTLASVARAGLADARAIPEMSLLQGWVDPRDLDTLAGLSCVKKITLPRYGSPR